MIRTAILAALALVCVASTAEARSRHHVIIAHERCNIDWPCDGVSASPRGEMIVKAMRGFGTAQKIYHPQDSRGRRARQARPRAEIVRQVASVVPHPQGCPSRAFCGCGAAVRVFGAPIRALWLAANWFKFPRTQPATGMVAVRAHHVFVLEADLGNGIWQVFDANSGGGLTRVHARSLAGYVIVNPRGGAA